MPRKEPPARPDSLTDVPGVRVGQAAVQGKSTGVTVARFDRAVPSVVSVLGGASATYDTGSLALESTFGRRWAIFFAGGSVFGLDAARGVREAILDSGGGHRVFRNPTRVAPVSGATLFDLPVRPGAPLPDYAGLGAAAARSARRDPVAQGRVGAGSGAMVGKYLGREFAGPGGVGSASARLPGIGTVGVLVVVNAVGAVFDPLAGRWVAGARRSDGELIPPEAARLHRVRAPSPPTGTTLVLVATDGPLPRPRLQRVAFLASAGLARAIVPLATATDGDVVFVVSTGEGRREPSERYPGETADRVGWSAADLAARAAVRAVSPATARRPGRRPR